LGGSQIIELCHDFRSLNGSLNEASHHTMLEPNLRVGLVFSQGMLDNARLVTLGKWGLLK
jgi:hypothetical protein